MKTGMFALMAAGLVLMGLTGCKKEAKPATEGEAAVEEKAEAAEKAVEEQPAAAKPKDHPAH